MHLLKKTCFSCIQKTPDNTRYYYNTDVFHCKLFLGWKQWVRDHSYQIKLIHSFYEPAFFYDEKKNEGFFFFLTYFGLHASEPHSGLCAESDGLLVSGVEDVNQLGVVSARRAVIESWKSYEISDAALHE